MKTVIAILTLVLAIAFNSSAQTTPIYAPQTVLSSYIVAIGQTSNSIGAVIDCSKQSNTALQWQVASTTFAETTNVVMRVSGSVDGSTYDTNRWVLTANATTAPLNVLVTNLNTAGLKSLRVDSITATGIAATNNLKYGIKIQAP